jgi:transcriptional regulator GlxA family with amidase domain
MKMQVAILLYPGVELVDMAGPMDVFLHVNAIIPDRYQIYTVAENSTALKSEGGILTITPDYDFSNCPAPDILVVPGLLDAELNPTVAGQGVIDWIKKMMSNDIRVLSVCVGLYNVAATGLLTGKTVTTHYLAINSFHKQYPDVNIVKNVRYCQDGNLTSSGGITSGIDAALYIVAENDGDDVAQEVADIMVYNRNATLPPFTILPPYYL